MDDRDNAGRFLPGNRIWEARSTAGPKPKFKGPDQLWNACVEYFEWAHANPLMEGVAYQGKVSAEGLPKLRAMTITGLCVFLDIARSTWDEWRHSRPDLSDVLTRVEAIIYEQKFTGAAAGLLVHNIIARDLGLADRSEISGRDGGPIKTEDVSARERIASRIAGLAARRSETGDTGEPE